MAGIRKTPKLRKDGKYYIASIYKPDGQRTNISFGCADERTEGEIYITFGKWLNLFTHQPQKVLSFKSPYEAIEQIISPSNIVMVGQLLDKYQSHVKKSLQSVKSNPEHPDLGFLKRVESFLQPYSAWPVDQFGPDELYAVQKALIQHEYVNGKKKKRYTRRGVNDVTKWIKRIWKWGVGRQLVPIEGLHALDEIKSLRIGESEAADNNKRKRVTEEDFRKVLAKVNPVVADMLRIIWLTAMRPYEVCEMRPFDILRDDPECWLYIPGRDHSPVGKHKTMRFARVKVIPLTAEAQKILKPRIKDFESKEYIFSPLEAVEIVLKNRNLMRKTPLNSGNKPGTNRSEHPMIHPRDRYNHNSLCRACIRACEKGGVEKFVPYDLRRTAATGTRSVLGKEAAKVLLGHTRTDTTDIYLLEEVQEAIKVAKLLGPQRTAI